MAISCATRENIPQLQAKIEEVVLSHPSLSAQVPVAFPILAEILKEYATQLAVPIITRGELARLGNHSVS